MTTLQSRALLLVATVGALALACCTTLPWQAACGQGSGRVVDEAMCVGRAAARIPAAAEE